MVTNAPQTNVGVGYTEEQAAAQPASDTEPLDVWLRWDADDTDDIATYEANTFRTTDGYRVEWYHNEVGQVTKRWFDTYVAAQEWLTANDFQDYTS